MQHFGSKLRCAKLRPGWGLTFDTQSGFANTVQQDNYMPFGMDIPVGTVGSPKNEYLYNKKEFQEQLGLYDYGARFYDPVIARWTIVDPKAELDRRWSPYIYTFGDPMRFTDPDGMWPDCTTCDLLIGYAAAVVDNNTGGLLPVRQLAGHLVSDAKSFNRGQDAGDIASIIQGGAEVSGGEGTVTGAAVATVGSGGLAIEVTAPAAALGGLAIAHGAVVGGHGAFSLASQKGRLNAEGLQGAKDAQKQQKKGQAPDGVDRVDIPKRDPNGNPLHGQQSHAHVSNGKKKSAINQDGSLKHGTGTITETVKNWLQSHGWKL